ncbi:MAG: RNA polymerase sigma factor RpoE [Pseudomonadota bacterium]
MSEREVDYELVKRVQSGEKAAFDLLVRKYQSRVVSLVGRFVNSPDEVDDVAQEAFIKAYRGLKNFRGDSAFYTWLYRIAVNTAKNYLVSRQRRGTHIGADIQEAEQYDGAELLREYDTPEQLLESEQARDKVIEAIQALPDELREAIMLRELEGLSYEEIAQMMGCPIGTVRSRIFRAREAIEKGLNTMVGE